MITDRQADIARGAAALAATLALVAGVPAGLWRLAGWPFPRSLPAWPEVVAALRSPYVPDELLITVLAIVCWLAWAQLLICLIVEAAALVRGRAATRVPLAGPIQGAAAHLVASITLIGTLFAPKSATPFAAMPLLASPLVVASSVSELTASDTPIEEQTPPTLPIEEAPAPTYTVQPRDDLWSIAERHLGDPLRWPEIWNRNRGRGQPDGRTFRDPDLIFPGWILELPADAVGVAPFAGHDGPGGEPTAPRAGVGAEPARPEAPSAEQPSPATVTTPEQPPPGTVATTSERPITADEGPRTPVPVDGARSHDDADRRAAPGVELPSGALVGASLAAGISAALVIARLHRRRRHLPADPQPGITRTDPLSTQLIHQLRRAHLTQADPVNEPSGTPSAGSSLAEPAPHARPGGTVTIGHRADQPILVDLTTMGGLCLAGPAAIDIARAILIDLLANIPADTVQVVITGASLVGDLLPGAAPIPSLDVIDGLDTALTRFEVELIHRTRQFDDADAADFHDYTRRHPEEPMPALILVASKPEPTAHQRLEAVLNLGRRLGIGSLILGHHPTLPTITVDTDGRVISVEPAEALPELSGSRLCTLTPADAAQIIVVMSAAHGAEPVLDDAQPETEPFPTEPTSAQAPISVCLLGPMRIDADGEEVRTGLRSKARELFAFFLLHPRGATAEATADALWPDADADRGIERFRTVLGNLRSTLRAAADLGPDTMLIERRGERYQADVTLIDCDLWRFQAALTEAANASDKSGVSAALQQATEAYAGDLLEGAYYEWAEPAREDLRRRAIDALAKLAELHEAAGDPDAALAALNQAIGHDPYAEELYRRIMRLQAILSRPDAIRRTYRLLETRLTDLDADPDPTTLHLVEELLRRPATTGSRT